MKTEILTTTDYTKFKIINGNRNLNQKKIDAIVSDINNGLNLLPYVPVIVYEEDNYLMLVDGQHRFSVSQALDLPVYYVISEKLSLRQMAMINNRQDKWKMTDFLLCYIKIGIKDYQIVKDVMKQFKVAISTATDLLMLGKISKNSTATAKFKDGEFKCNYQEETIALLTLSHSLFERYVFYTDRNLLTAVQQINEKGLCDFEMLKEKINNNPMMMDKQGSVKDYIYNIERVYNHSSKIRKIIF